MSTGCVASKKRLAVWLAIVAFVWLGLPGVARANTINVSLSGTDLIADGTCTLREALTGGFTECTPTGPAGPLVIQLPAGTKTWTGADPSGAAMPPLVASVIIRGAGAGSTILAANPSASLRLFDVKATTNVTIEGITFEGWTGNGPYNRGGGVIWQAENSELTIRDCVFRNNRTTNGYSQGGAISTFNEGADPTKLTIERTKFEGNDSYYAGAVWAAGASVALTDVTFSGNTAGSVGGALRIVTSNAAQVVSITSTTFVDNSVPDLTHGNAGAVTLQGPGSFTIKGSTFTRNIAPGYGALWANGVTLTIDSCTFEDNVAVAADTGAVASEGALHVLDSVFTGNKGFAGAGALYCGVEGDCLVERSRFEGNRASSGGAIFSGSKSLTVVDSIFFDNVADLMSLTVVATDNKATEGADTATFTLDRRLSASAIRAQSPTKISGSCFLGAVGQIVFGNGVAVDARGNFWTTSDVSVRGNAAVDSSEALTVAPTGCDPLRKPTQGKATLTATYAGEATPDVDYLALPAMPVFEPGVSTLELEVMPIFDELVDGGEGISMTAVYPVTGTSAVASVQILDGVSSDLRIVGVVDHETATVGDELVFTLTITNEGPGPAMNVVVSDMLPEGLFGLFVDASLPSGALVQCVLGPPPTCTIAMLAAGEVASVTVRVRADVAGEIGNHAEVAVASDTKPANNSSDVVITVSPAPDDGTAGAGAGGDGNGGAGAADAGGGGAESGEGGTTDTGAGGTTDTGAATNGGAADGGAAEGGDSDGRAVTRQPAGCGCRMAGDVPGTDSRLGGLALVSLIAACALRRRRKALAAN